MNRLKILSWHGLLFCLVIFGFLLVPDHAAWAQASNSTDFDATTSQTHFNTFAKALQNLAGVLLLIGIVIAGVLYSAGKPQYAIGVLVAAVVIFGTPYIVSMVSGQLAGQGSTLVTTSGTAGTIEGSVSQAIASIESTVQGFAIMLCAIYGSLLGIDALLGGLDSARLNAFVIGVILVCSTPVISSIFRLIFNG